MRLRTLLCCLAMFLLAMPATAMASDTRGLLLTQRFKPGGAPAHQPIATSMLALRGETEGFQLAFRGNGQRLTPRLSAGSDAMLRANTRLLRVGFVDVRRASTGIGRRGRYADPLPRIAGGGIPTASGRWAGTVVLVDVPRGAAARRYRGRVELVNASGKVVRARSFSLRVSKVATYPAGHQRAFRAIVGIQPTWYRQQAPISNPNANGGAAPIRQMLNLHRFLARQHLVPNNYPHALPASSGTYIDGSGWFRHRATNLRRYMQVPARMRLLPHFTGGFSFPRVSNATAGRFAGRARAHWARQGHVRRGTTYLWAWDEPGLHIQRGRLPGLLRTLDASSPGTKLIVTSRPQRENRHLWDGGRNDVDVWAIPQQRYYGTWKEGLTARKRFVQQVKRRGKEVWSYYYYVPQRGLPHLVIDGPGADPRLMMLWNGHEGHRGWLVWQAARWVQPRNAGRTRNPYTNTHSYTTPGGAIANGDTSLFYPPYAPQYGLHDPTAEPVSSLRLESLRDGIEDADLVDRHRVRYGKAATDRVLGRVFGPVRLLPNTGHSWASYGQRNLPVRMEQARRAMIVRLER